MINIYDVAGVSGSLIIAFEYFYSQYKHTFLNSTAFFIGNILGSSLILLSLIFSSFNLASFSIETLWIAVSVYGLFKYTLKNNNSDIFIASYRQNEFSVDGFPSSIEERKFTKDDLGIEILFKNPFTKNTIAEKSGFLNTFLLNGTAIFSPNAITDSNLNINSLDKIEYSKRFNLYTIKLEENREYHVNEVNVLLNDLKNESFLYIETEFMKNNMKNVINGVPNNDFFNSEKVSLSEDVAIMLGKNKLIKGIMIDSISFECESSRREGMTNTFNIMGINTNVGIFKPLIYHIKTPNKKYEFVSIRMGNVPNGIIPSYPVEIIFF